MLKKICTAIYDNRANIEFIAGGALVVAGTAIAISKAEEAVEVKGEMERQIKNIELTDEADGWENNGERTKACLTMAKSTAVGYVKTYGLPIGIEIGGLVLMTISHATLNNQIGCLSASLASTSLAFAQYRERVKQELGEEKDEEFLLGKPQKVVDENGEHFQTTDLPFTPPHSFIFDESNPNYSKEHRRNLEFLEDHLRWLNEKLWYEGILWENDIRREIMAPIDPDATNWGITAVDEEGNRQYISFGIEKNTERAQAFRDGKENSFWVTLNMEPNISKKMYRLDKYRK